MTDCLVFNHHSLPFDHLTDAESAIPDFLKMCIEAKNAGMQTILVDDQVDRSWFRLELASGYFWQNWYDQHRTGTNLDAIRAFRSIVTQSPLFNANDISDGADLFEVTLDGCPDYSTVRAAAWHEAPLAGFETRAPWNFSPLKVIITRINLETNELESGKAEIQNFHNYSVFRQSLPKLLEKRTDSLSSGKKIVCHFQELYPEIFLCGKAIQQLNNWSGSVTLLNQVKQSLLSLSQFAKNWKSGEFEFYRAEALRQLGLAFKVSGESETVGNHPALRREREFWLPSGRKKYFEQHVKMSGGYRLHFYPDKETRQIYVGYIGPHLKLR